VSGVRHRRKGNRVERTIVRVLQDHGFAAERVPLSGAARGRFGGDVSVPLLGRDRRVEVARARSRKSKKQPPKSAPLINEENP
jgi:Holliday junction resolvase